MLGTIALTVVDIPHGIGTALLLDGKVARPWQTVSVQPGYVDGTAVVLDRAETLDALCVASILTLKASILRVWARGKRGGWRKVEVGAHSTMDALEVLANDIEGRIAA